MTNSYLEIDDNKDDDFNQIPNCKFYSTDAFNPIPEGGILCTLTGGVQNYPES